MNACGNLVKTTLDASTESIHTPANVQKVLKVTVAVADQILAKHPIPVKTMLTVKIYSFHQENIDVFVSPGFQEETVMIMRIPV